MSGSLRERHLAFADAVLALSAEPTSPNVVRYLVASRDLPDRRRPDQKRVEQRRSRARQLDA
jgi:hypothetical protein